MNHGERHQIFGLVRRTGQVGEETVGSTNGHIRVHPNLNVGLQEGTGGGEIGYTASGEDGGGGQCNKRRLGRLQCELCRCEVRACRHSGIDRHVAILKDDQPASQTDVDRRVTVPVVTAHQSGSERSLSDQSAVAQPAYLGFDTSPDLIPAHVEVQMGAAARVVVGRVAARVAAARVVVGMVAARAAVVTLEEEEVEEMAEVKMVVEEMAEEMVLEEMVAVKDRAEMVAVKMEEDRARAGFGSN